MKIMLRKDLYALQYAIVTPNLKRVNQHSEFWNSAWCTVHIAKSREGARRGFKEHGKTYRTAHPDSATVGVYVASGQTITE